MWLSTFLDLDHIDILNLLGHNWLSWAETVILSNHSWSGHEIVLNQIQEGFVLVEDMQVGQSGVDVGCSQALELVVVNWELFSFSLLLIVCNHLLERFNIFLLDDVFRSQLSIGYRDVLLDLNVS